MLLNKKNYSLAAVFFALSPLMVTTLESRAADDVAAPASPVAETWAKSGRPKQVIDTELGKYIQGFKIKKITDSEGNTHLAMYGTGLPGCLAHLKVDLDKPIDGDTGVYALRFSKTDFVSSSGKAATADGDCSEEKTKQCTRDPDSGCVSIAQALPGINGVESTPLDTDGHVGIRVDNEKENDPALAIQYRDISKAMGGPIVYESPETHSAKQDVLRAQEHNELIAATCRGAEKGSREDLENLKEMLGSDGVNDKAKLIAKLEAKVNEHELGEFEKNLDDAESIEKLLALIEDSSDYAKDHPDMKKSIVKFLVDGIAKKALDLDSEGKDLKTFNVQKEKVAEKALKVAHQLDPKNASLRAAYEKARHLRTKETATTDNMYNETTRAEAINGFSSVLNWAASSKSTEARGALADYINDMPANMKPYAAQMANGNLNSSDRDVLANMYGLSLDQSAQAHSMTEEFDAYRRNATSNPMYGGQNTSYSQAGGGSMNGRF